MKIAFDVGCLRDHLYAAIAVLVGLFGWFMSFIGLCLIGTTIAPFANDVKRNRINWFYTFLHLFVLLAVSATIFTRTVRPTRVAVSGFLSLSLVTLFLGMDLAILEAQFTSSIASAANVRAAGTFFLTASFAILLCYYGIEWETIFDNQDSGYVKPRNSTYGPPISSAAPRSAGFALPTMNFNAPTKPTQSEQPTTSNPSQSLISSAVPIGMAPAPTSRANMLTSNAAVVTQNNTIGGQSPAMPAATATPGSLAFKSSAAPSSAISNELNTGRQVKALYAYTANASDPAEISFVKGEILTIIETKGKWWRVTKTLENGSKMDGIAPSNYLQIL
ncbi:Transmembrane osmosensor [Batrachochytrium dendrobatidis]|nr:Transmembrane osmosensor [Batrachochytrium dendrobatidis]